MPKHGQAKPIERFFGTLEEGFGKFCYGYAGNDAKKRPDYLHKLSKKLANDPNIQEIDDFIKACNNWIENVYSDRSHGGNAMNGKSPNEVYAQEMGKLRTFDNKQRLAAICGEREQRIVRHDCIELLGRTYRAKDGALVNYIGAKVTIVYMPENIDVIYVYDEKFRYICNATAVVRTSFRTSTMEDYQEIRREQKKARKIVNSQMPKARLSVTDSLIQRQAAENAYTQINETAPASEGTSDSPELVSKKRESAFQIFNSFEEKQKKKEVI